MPKKVALFRRAPALQSWKWLTQSLSPNGRIENATGDLEQLGVNESVVIGLHEEVVEMIETEAAAAKLTQITVMPCCSCSVQALQISMAVTRADASVIPRKKQMEKVHISESTVVLSSLVPRRPLPLSQKGGLVSIDAFLGPDTLAISKSGSLIRSQNNQ